VSCGFICISSICQAIGPKIIGFLPLFFPKLIKMCEKYIEKSEEKKKKRKRNSYIVDKNVDVDVAQPMLH
jgi:hypothetical protein